MTTSFPYFAIARRFGIPYGQVLRTLCRFDGKPNNAIWPLPGADICEAIGEAWAAETERRLRESR